MSSWELEFHEWVESKEGLREALCTLGNGYMAIRGASEESSQDGTHYHGTYLGGGHNRATSVIGGKIIENEDLVNWPDFTGLSFRINQGTWFHLEEVKILHFEQILNVKKGILQRKIHFIQGDQETLLETLRFVSMDHPHLAVFRWEMTPLNWKGRVDVRSSIDGSVTNQGVKRYRDFTAKHLAIEDLGLAFEDSIYLVARTLHSSIQMAITSKTNVFEENNPIPLERETFSYEEKIEQILSFFCVPKQKIKIEKIVSVYTSRDFAIHNPLHAGKKLIQRTMGVDYLLKKHEQRWRILWQRFNITLKEMDEETKILRLHIFHLLQTACHHSVDRDISIPARGLHGEAYRGHIFWDEMFIFPLFYFRMPRLARSLLMYRYRRLEEARGLAREEGLKGAMFPWQSGSDGGEVGQKIHLNPESGHWVPDHTHRQRHINGAVSYNIVKYLEATDDREFHSNYGMEIILEIARFWMGLVRYNHNNKRYEIHDVVGPDEFHTCYPGSDHPGIHNNAYTNFMASWSTKKCVELLYGLEVTRKEEILERLDLPESEIIQWSEISRNILIPFIEEGLIAQFEGYEKLLDFNWAHYRERYDNLQRLDRLLEKEGDDVNRYKVNKQADVLMLFYLFSVRELKEHFHWMNYSFNSSDIKKNVTYYLPQSSSGSSLGRIVHSWVMARLDRKHSWGLFKEALLGDISDGQVGTTAEGIHLGAMAGTVDIIQRCFTGLEIRDEVLWFSPKLPDELIGIKFSLCYRSHWLNIEMDHSHLSIQVEHSYSPGGKLGFRGEVYHFEKGSVFHFPFKNLEDKALEDESESF